MLWPTAGTLSREVGGSMNDAQPVHAGQWLRVGSFLLASRAIAGAALSEPQPAKRVCASHFEAVCSPLVDVHVGR